MTTPTPSRRLKWRHPSPPPPPHSPKIIHLPRRPRRKSPKPTAKKLPFYAEQKRLRHSLAPVELHNGYYPEHLENFLVDGGELSASGDVPIVVLNSVSSTEKTERIDRGDGEAAMFQAACDFLRMEREFALKKLERNRAQTDTTLKLAVQTLGKKEAFVGKEVEAIGEEEIEDLGEKVEELKKSSKKNRDLEKKKCSDFDKQTSLLQKRILEKLSGSSCERCQQDDLSETNSMISNGTQTHNESLDQSTNVIESELSKTMEGESNCMLDRREAEEYGAINSITANSSVPSSPPSTSKQIENCSVPSAFSPQQPHQVGEEEGKCSGRCKAMVRKIIEQVKEESEQWSEMQEMLGRVRDEMHQLHASRHFWELRSQRSSRHIQSLRFAVEEWKERALASKAKVNELEMQLYAAQASLKRLRTSEGASTDKSRESTVESTHNSPKISLSKQIEKEMDVLETADEDMPPISLAKQIKKEKKKHMMLLRRLTKGNERRRAEARSDERSPLRDVANSSALLVRRNNLAVFPWRSPDRIKAGHCILKV
ncbi:unnamed protein product [Cuscuta epithymum]|uniref:Uncharacterized protein n=2 Tax=Cuscuta epithymum TaxID=186058 RepID=A0AAV0FG56_9ASTE|nr:unnamed protein product [Cuscuta epithymum]